MLSPVCFQLYTGAGVVPQVGGKGGNFDRHLFGFGIWVNICLFFISAINKLNGKNLENFQPLLMNFCPPFCFWKFSTIRETEAIDKVVWQQILTILLAENGQIHTMGYFTTLVFACFAGGETGGEAKMGFATSGKAPKRHCPRVPWRFCTLDHGKETSHVRPVKSRPKGQDETYRLFATSW